MGKRQGTRKDQHMFSHHKVSEECQTLHLESYCSGEAPAGTPPRVPNNVWGI